MSNKIRFTGLIMAALILLTGLVVACALSSSSIGEVADVKLHKISDNSAEITWKKTSKADGYYLYQRVNGEEEYEKIADVESSEQTSFVFENLDDTTVYDAYINAYKIRKKGNFESEKHKDLSFCTLPKKQKISLIKSNVGEIEATLEENSRANGYKIEYSLNEDFSDSKEITVEDVTSLSDKIGELETGKTYYFRACSFIDYNGETIYGDWSDTVSEIAPDEETLNEVDPSKPMIAVTFDDGPGYNSASEKILDVIEKYHIKATFFMVGKNACDNPANVKRKVELGCELGNHTWDHSNYGKKVSPESIKMATDAISEAGGGAKVTAFRSPGGNTTSVIRDECKKEGMALYYWSLDTQDWKSRDAQKVYSAVMDNVKDGDIILMHEIYPTTADAFEKMVPELIKQGYQFVTCEQLVKAKTGSEPEPGTQYVNGSVINNETS